MEGGGIPGSEQMESFSLATWRRLITRFMQGPWAASGDDERFLWLGRVRWMMALVPSCRVLSVSTVGVLRPGVGNGCG